jgi:hypothetical protein
MELRCPCPKILGFIGYFALKTKTYFRSFLVIEDIMATCQTPRSTVLLEELIFALLVKNFPAFYEFRMFITVPILSQLNPINMSWTIYLIPILILSSLLRLQSGIFLSGFLNKLLRELYWPFDTYQNELMCGSVIRSEAYSMFTCWHKYILYIRYTQQTLFVVTRSSHIIFV